MSENKYTYTRKYDKSSMVTISWHIKDFGKKTVEYDEIEGNDIETCEFSARMYLTNPPEIRVKNNESGETIKIFKSMNTFVNFWKKKNKKKKS
jgi:hypothetical protein